MPQYGGGVGFSKMKNKLNRSLEKKRSRKKRSRKKRSRKKRSKRLKIRERKEKVCGCGTHKYTGKESSPRGLGKCEECIPLNVMLRGKDGDLYENKGHQWKKL